MKNELDPSITSENYILLNKNSRSYDLNKLALEYFSNKDFQFLVNGNYEITYTVTAQVYRTDIYGNITAVTRFYPAIYINNIRQTPQKYPSNPTTQGGTIQLDVE